MRELHYTEQRIQDILGLAQLKILGDKLKSYKTPSKSPAQVLKVGLGGWGCAQVGCGGGPRQGPGGVDLTVWEGRCRAPSKSPTLEPASHMSSRWCVMSRH